MSKVYVVTEVRWSETGKHIPVTHAIKIVNSEDTAMKAIQSRKEELRTCETGKYEEINWNPYGIVGYIDTVSLKTGDAIITYAWRIDTFGKNWSHYYLIGRKGS